MNTPADSNPYQPPAAEVVDRPLAVAARDESALYIVSPRKFLIMMVGTTGIYAIYWFYRNWAQLRRQRGVRCLPLLRCIFSMFFTHSLFRRIDGELRQNAPAASFAWSPMALATLYVASAVLSSVVGQFSGLRGAPPVLRVMPIVFLAPMSYALYRAQQAIDQAEQDPAGTSNATLGAANIAWLVFGGLIWLANLFNLYLLLSGTPD